MHKKSQKICIFKKKSYLCNPFQKGQYWRVGRVVECGGLENRWSSRVRGFESLTLRKTQRKIASSLLERDFLFCALQRPAAGGEGRRSAATKSLRERDLWCDVSSGFSTCKGPTGEVQGMSERSDEIPEREGFVVWALALAFQLARAPRQASRDVRT